MRLLVCELAVAAERNTDIGAIDLRRRDAETVVRLIGRDRAFLTDFHRLDLTRQHVDLAFELVDLRDPRLEIA